MDKKYRIICMVVFIILLIITTVIRKFIKPKLSERTLKIFNVCSIVAVLLVIAIVFYMIFF